MKHIEQALQWGHGGEAVELMSHGVSGADLRRFNGATAVKPWNSIMAAGPRLVIYPRFNGATAVKPWNSPICGRSIAG